MRSICENNQVYLEVYAKKSVPKFQVYAKYMRKIKFFFFGICQVYAKNQVLFLGIRQVYTKNHICFGIFGYIMEWWRYMDGIFEAEKSIFRYM